jgi:hypothetical protein
MVLWAVACLPFDPILVHQDFVPSALRADGRAGDIDLLMSTPTPEGKVSFILQHASRTNVDGPADQAAPAE